MPRKPPDDAKPPLPSDGLRIRPLAPDDLAAIVAIDKAVAGRSRRGFYEKRLAHLVREPSAFVALAAERDSRLVGFVFARVYEGEFGGAVPEAALDAIGVAADARRSRVGRRLIDAMAAAMRIHGITEISTQADWTDTALTGFFARMNFALAPRIVLERSVAAPNAD
jgi:ribosomal protein S18 acetylase RimI-like enzyme